MATDPERMNIARTFDTAIGILDESETEVRALIENELFDKAGIGRMKVTDGILLVDALAKKIAVIRERHIKRAFAFLRDNLPDDEIQRGINQLEEKDRGADSGPAEGDG
jgi:hypothetical protein